MSAGPGARTAAGTVIEELPSLMYRVELEGRQQVLAHPVGAVRRNFVRLLPGDRVEVVLMPHDVTRGRITRKLSGGGSQPGAGGRAEGPGGRFPGEIS